MLKRLGFLSFVVSFGMLCTGCAGGSKALDVDAAASAGNPTEQIFGQRVIGRPLELKARGGGASNRTSIELHSDGTSDVEVVEHIYRTFGATSPTTRTRSGKGHWWIKDKLFCHQSSIIEYGTRDCYRMTRIGNTLRLYYDKCTHQSSRNCKPGREFGFGSVN